MDKTKRMPATEKLQDIARQGFYFIIRYYDGDEVGTHVTDSEALAHAVRLKRPGFQIVKISLR